VELLAAGPMRFNEIRHTIGNISQRMLTLTLRELERDGLVTRTLMQPVSRNPAIGANRVAGLLYRRGRASLHVPSDCGPCTASERVVATAGGARSLPMTTT
jgi:DNA-binding Lrp family transcriptional regulator